MMRRRKLALRKQMLAFEATPKDTTCRRIYFKLDDSDEETLEQDDEGMLEKDLHLNQKNS